MSSEGQIIFGEDSDAAERKQDGPSEIEPADFDLSLGDVRLVMGDASWRKQTGRLIERFHISEDVARRWRKMALDDQGQGQT